MHTHADTRLTPRGRLRLVSGHLHKNRSLPELAAEADISLRCAYKWLARYRSGGTAALVDRRSVRRWLRRTLRRPTETATGPGVSSPTPPPPARRQAAGRSLLHRGQGAQPPWSRAVAKSRTQTSSAALRAGASWRPDPYRRQKARALSQGRAPHHR